MTENLDCAILGLMLKVLSYILRGVTLILGSVLGWGVFKLGDWFAELLPILKSVVFQGVLALLALYATSSGRSLLASAFLLSALVRSFYLQYQDCKKGKLEEWFVVLKEPVTKEVLAGYFIVIGTIFVYSLVNLIL